MTRRAPDTPDADAAEAALLDDPARAEAAWLIARDRDPEAAPPSPQIARDYAEIEDLLGRLPGPTDDRWHDEVMQAAASVTPPLQRRAPFRGSRIAAIAVAAVAVAGIALWLRPPRAPDAELEVAIRHADPSRGDSREIVVGDRLVVTARPRGPGDLRVFRSDGTQVARCPGGPACNSSTPRELTLDLHVDAPVRYHVILVVGMNHAAPDCTMNMYLDVAHSAHGRIVQYAPIDVH